MTQKVQAFQKDLIEVRTKLDNSITCNTEAQDQLVAVEDALSNAISLITDILGGTIIEDDEPAYEYGDVVGLPSTTERAVYLPNGTNDNRPWLLAVGWVDTGYVTHRMASRGWVLDPDNIKKEG